MDGQTFYDCVKWPANVINRLSRERNFVFSCSTCRLISRSAGGPQIMATQTQRAVKCCSPIERGAASLSKCDGRRDATPCKRRLETRCVIRPRIAKRSLSAFVPLAAGGADDVPHLLKIFFTTSVPACRPTTRLAPSQTPLSLVCLAGGSRACVITFVCAALSPRLYFSHIHFIRGRPLQLF